MHPGLPMIGCALRCYDSVVCPLLSPYLHQALGPYKSELTEVKHPTASILQSRQHILHIIPLLAVSRVPLLLLLLSLKGAFVRSQK